MVQIEHFVYRNFQIDTNRINSRGRLENMNLLEKWHGDDVISIEMSEIAQDECLNDTKRYQKTNGYIFSKTLANTSEEQIVLRQIENILFPKGGATTKNKKNDVEIVFNAWEYKVSLITDDRHILDREAELAVLGICVLKDDEAVRLVRDLIAVRDQLATERNKKYGLLLPEWVGKD
jgi:hypothetical protein